MHIPMSKNYRSVIETLINKNNVLNLYFQHDDTICITFFFRNSTIHMHLAQKMIILEYSNIFGLARNQCLLYYFSGY